ncbi:MAG: iron-containing alcohol dehydrogenase [Ruminococcaceae bacterium]|nr:iron-containing alcohol dehydrogenase [Oscillospiraceae bacterium]
MNPFKKAFCRVYQFCFHLALPVLPYREPKILKNVNEIPAEIKKLNLKKALIITDEFLKKSGATEEMELSLYGNNIEFITYDKTRPNPTTANVEEALKLYNRKECQCLIAFGGGSAIDCAKAVGARVASPKRSLDKLKGTLRIFRKIPALFAVPTTAGTGSEVTVTAVITDAEKKHKYTMNSFPLIPHYAVLDPKVTYTLPKHLTSTTGMDALTHAVEAYIGRSTSKETRRLSKEAVKLIFKNIETAYSEPENYTARENMLKAAYKAGIAFSKSYVGYVHAVAHSLGGQYNVPHGLANSVLLPCFLEAYGEKIHKKLYDLAVYSGVADENDTHKAAAEKFIEKVKTLNGNMNIPKKIAGIKEEDVPLMAKHADKEGNPLYPVPVLMNAQELEKFYFSVME